MAAGLVGALSADEAVASVDTAGFRSAGGAVALVVHGRDLSLLAKAVTRAIAETRVDVDLVQPSSLALDAIRAANPGGGSA